MREVENDMFAFLSKKRKQRVHFLHIGKTGGSAIKAVLKEFPETPRYTINLHGHSTSLKDVPKGEPVVFFLREPVSRFVSGFYSRQRKGQPRYYSEWSPKEKKVFDHFPTPGKLATSLANEEALALMAMEHILHFKRYSAWYGDFDYFESRLDDVLFVGFQESLDAGFAQLKRILEIPDEVDLPTDDVGAHRNPRSVDKTVDERGVAALRKWYSEDIRFVSLCKQFMSKEVSVARVPSSRRAAA
jgi:hypothetical protein